MATARFKEESVHESDAKNLRTKRLRSRPKLELAPIDETRRQRCLESPPTFLKTYQGEIFYQEFTEQRLAMVNAIVTAAKYGGDQAIAAERGGGKTTIAMAVSLCLMLALAVKFPVIVGKNQKASERELSDNIKEVLEENELLAADFPEVCWPIKAIKSWGSKTKQQTAMGQQTRIIWSADRIVLPTFDAPWSAARGQAMASMGWEGRVRGTKIRSVRPDLAIIDDLDDRQSAQSTKQTSDRKEVIEQDIRGLAGPDINVARVMLCTVVSPTCVAAVYTDREQSPNWGGLRYRRLVQWPEDMDLWNDFIRLRQTRDMDNDKHGRVAEEQYLKNYQAMQVGAEVSNPDRYDGRLGEDGKPLELDALQSCFIYIADGGDEGLTSFLREYQNEPLEEDKPQESEITATLVSERVNGFEQRVCSPRTHCLTFFADVGVASNIHWGVVASQKNGTAQFIDYGIKGVSRARVDGSETAILTALRELREELAATVYVNTHGEPVPVDLYLVDCGHWNTTVYTFVMESGRRWRASMGPSRYKDLTENTESKRAGFHLWQSRQGPGNWVVNMDTVYWKGRVHDGFLLETFIHQDDVDRRGADPDSLGNLRPCSLSLWGETPKEHVSPDTGNFARQIVAEKWRREAFKEGKGAKDGWHKYHPDNHYLDVAVGCLCGASMKGVKPVSMVPVGMPPDRPDSPPPPKPESREPAWSVLKNPPQSRPPAIPNVRARSAARRRQKPGFVHSYRS